MKLFFHFVLPIFIGLYAPLAIALTEGDLAPPFELYSDTSSTIKLSNYKGKLVYLDFWASWCGPCKQSFPWLNEMQAKYGAKGFQVIAINLDSNPADAAAFLKVVPAKFTIAYDSKGLTPKLFAIKGMPTSALVDEQGKIILFHTGFKPADKVALEQAIANSIKK